MYRRRHDIPYFFILKILSMIKKNSPNLTRFQQTNDHKKLHHFKLIYFVFQFKTNKNKKKFLFLKSTNLN